MNKMEKKAGVIGFTLSKISTEQYAIIDKGFSNKNKTDVGFNLRVGVNAEKKLIGVFPRFIFESNREPFIIIECGCHFKVPKLKNMYNNDDESFHISRDFLCHLAMLSVGTCRGILHAKTEGSPFNKYVIPTINLLKIITSDAVIKPENITDAD